MKTIIYFGLVVCMALAIGVYMFVTYLNPAPSDKAQPDPLAIEDLPPVSQVPADVMTAIAAKSELILVRNPKPLAAISSPLNVSGVARSGWFFEGSFPVTVTDWNGLIIGEGFVTAQGDWMTTEFVPFTGEIVFTVATDTPYRRGTVIFQKDNPSGLPENDDALEIPVNFE